MTRFLTLGLKSVFRLIPGFIFLGGAALLVLDNAPWTQQLSRIVIIISLFYLLYNAIKAIYACLDIITVWSQYNARGHHQPINLEKAVKNIRYTNSLIIKGKYHGNRAISHSP